MAIKNAAKVVIAGGSGHVGAVLLRHFSRLGCEIVVLSRTPARGAGYRGVQWDGRTLGAWAQEVDRADVVVNLAGRSVNCRYNAANLKEMMDSRVESTRVIGEAIAGAKRPPRVWLQSSTATIYAVQIDGPSDETTGILDGGEADAPRSWKASVDLAMAWERTLNEAETPNTRRVAMRTAMTMSVDKGSVFDVLRRLARVGLGGALGGGKQFVSWIHELDFANAAQFVIDRDDFAGPVNLCSPNPLPQAEFARVLRQAVGARFGLTASAWMVEFGTWAMRTESELVLKSRRVMPKRLIEAGFVFQYPEWSDAALELATRIVQSKP